MTLRTATRLGIIGIAIPLAMLPAQIVLATISGIPTRTVTANWDFLAMVRGDLPELIALVFLLVLYRAAEGSTTPERLSDVAMGAAILLIVSMALDLRWSQFVAPFSVRNWGWGWWRAATMVTGILEQFAWLAFLVTFVRLPEPPLRPASRRAAMLLGIALSLGLLLHGIPIAIQYLGLVEFSGTAGNYWSWNIGLIGIFTLLRYVLLLLFAIGAWRARPKIDPAG